MKNALQKIVTIQKSGKAVGIYSACSANPFVIEAVLKKEKKIIVVYLLNLQQINVINLVAIQE